MSRVPPHDEPDPASTSSFRWCTFRVRRHLYWARSQGIGRLIEEDELDPVKRIPIATKKLIWRTRHDASPNAVPLYVVGVQRSGTNMLVRGLEVAPEFEVHNENDRDAFDRFRLRSDEQIRTIVTRSRHEYVLFKPLCDSHRIGELLDDLGTPSAGRAIWAYRGVDGRVRSALAKFGDSNLRALARIASGTGDHLWQAQGLSAESRDLIGCFDYASMSPATAAALFWLVRNQLYFDLGLEGRDDVALASYDAMVRAPEPTMRGLCAFLGVPYDPGFVAHVEARAPKERTPLDIDPEVRTRCDAMQERLDRAHDDAITRLLQGGPDPGGPVG